MDSDFDEDIFELYRTISNGEESVKIYKRPDAELISSDGERLGNVDDDDEIDDKLDSYEAEWKETHFSKADRADYYGCNENEVDDCIDDDIKGLY